MAWQGFSSDNAPEAFGAMVRRQGASGGGGFRRPGGGYDGGGINPGGMYGGSPIQGGPFGPPRPDMTGGPVGDGVGYGFIPGGGSVGSGYQGGLLGGQWGLNPGTGSISTFDPFQMTDEQKRQQFLMQTGGSPIQGGPGSPPRPDTTGGMGPDPADVSIFQMPGGIITPGPAGGGYVPGRMDGIIPPGPHGGGPAGFSGIDGFDGRGVPQPDPVLRGGEGGPYGMQPSKSGLPPMHNPEWFGLGGVVPPGPHGGGPKGFPGMDGGSEVGSKADQRPMPIPDPRFPRNQPGMTRNQWQQNRLGNAPRLPVENPINPTEDWLGRSNGAPQGWNWSR